MISEIQILLSLVVGLSVLAVVVGLRALTSPAESSGRMQQVVGASGDGAPTLRQIEMSASFYQRIIAPMFSAVLQGLGRLAPQSNIAQLQKKLETAGYPANLSVIDFLGLKVLIGTIIAFFVTLATYMVRPDFSWLVLGALGLVFWFVGFMLPDIWLIGRIRDRKREIRRSLPDALDMLTICVDAGLGLSGAMQHVAEAWDNALCDEFTRVLAEVKLGRTRIEAMESMAQRCGVDEVISFVMAISLADKLGVSIAKVLRIQAKQMRIARRQLAEEAAREASIKMLFPLVFLIFPAMFAVILGPAVPLLLETLTDF